MNKKIRNTMHSFGTTILTNLFCLALGIWICSTFLHCEFVISMIVVIVAAGLLTVLTILYYRYEYNRIGVERKKITRNFKLFFWAIVGVVFGIYMTLVYSTYLKSYKENVFGIDQGQYIILLNFIIFMVVGLVTYQLITMKYNIKTIGKDGIELERVIEENSIDAVKTSTELVGDIYTELGELDKVVDFLYFNGKLDRDISEDDYIEILQLLCQLLVSEKNNIKIKVFSEGNYHKYLKYDLGLANREIRILNCKYQEYGIIKVDEGIHIRYEFAPFHRFGQSHCYIIMEFKQIYDIQIGKLIYAYVKLFEALYSKYLLIDE